MDREAALAWAGTVRRVRGEVLGEVESGSVSLEEVLGRAQEDPFVGMIHVLDVVEALPGWGKVVCRRTLGELGIGHHTPVSEVDSGTLRRAFAQAPA